jgi:hypothetical protein
VLAQPLQRRNALITSTKNIGMDVYKESISIAVSTDAGKIVMDCVIETISVPPKDSFTAGSLCSIHIYE